VIKPLTSLRFFAALAVVYDHLGTGSHTGGLGVLFFFLLSGFIIAFTYSSRTTTLSAPALSAIYASRFGRIFPIHLFTLALAIPIATAPSGPFVFITNALLMHSWYPSHLDYFSYNSVSWTLSIEWAFYLTFPFMLHAIKSLKLDTSRVGLALIYLLPIVALSAVSLLYVDRMEPFNQYWWLLKISPLNALVFVSGAAIGLQHINAGPRSPSRGAATCLEVGSLAGIAALYAMLVRWGVGKTLPLDYTLLFIPAFSLCIHAFSLSRGWVSAVLSWAPLVKLGELSFSIYMFHLILIRYADSYIIQVSGTSATAYAQVALVAATIALSYVAYHTIESPCRHASKALGKRLASRLATRLAPKERSLLR